MNKELDLIVFGATSFVGKIIAVILRLNTSSRIFPGL